MLATELEAKALLEAEGLQVSRQSPHGLWIAADVSDRGAGIRMSDYACALIRNGERWLAVFPAEGLGTYEVPGQLEELVSLISTVFDHQRQTEVPLKDAVRQTMPDADRYLLGGPAYRPSLSSSAIHP